MEPTFADIAELDPLAIRMRACFSKAENFMVVFARDYYDVSNALASGRYGPGWTINKWLMTKLHMGERQAQRRIKMFKDALSQDDREKVEEKEKELRIERAREKEVQEQAKLAIAKARLRTAQDREAAVKEVRRIKEAARLRRVRAAKKRTQSDTVSPSVRKSVPTPAPTPPPTLAPTPPPMTVTTVQCVCPLCGDAHQALVKKPKLTVVG